MRESFHEIRYKKRIMLSLDSGFSIAPDLQAPGTLKLFESHKKLSFFPIFWRKSSFSWPKVCL